jgi:Plasmid pRiA4b ORF-3-like protein
MSPASRGRRGQKGTKSTHRAPALPGLFDTPDECGCPSCTGADLSPEALVAGLIAAGADLLGSEDPLDAEAAGAVFVSVSLLGGEALEEVLVGELIPEIEARGTSAALAILLAIGSMARSRAGKAVSLAADRLGAAGVAPPAWAAELAEPLTVSDCWRLYDSKGIGSMLGCTFHRAGRAHAVVVGVNYANCGAADDILVLDVDQLPEAMEMMRADGREHGLEMMTETLDAAEFRWQVERALESRAVHDEELSEMDPQDLVDTQEGPGYHACAVLLRTRMNVLPAPQKPPAPPEDGALGLSLLQMPARLPGDDGGASVPPQRGTAAAPRQANGKKSTEPAPIYQIKVGLRGAKPPIWRRLEVPADITLARLHIVIQAAFDWDDTHMHVFETPYGNFGIADANLGHRAEAPVTLEQVAPTVSCKLRYTYDFGDDWEHDILVEKVLVPDRTAAYPRCTGGRRAAPPEDCGGIWGYAELVYVMSDPAHPDHNQKLEWLGLDDATEFDPTSFDAEAVTQALAALG